MTTIHKAYRPRRGLTDAAAEILDRAQYAILGTENPNGSPHLVPVMFRFEDGCIVQRHSDRAGRPVRARRSVVPLKRSCRDPALADGNADRAYAGVVSVGRVVVASTTAQDPAADRVMWQQVYRTLAARDRASLSAAELDTLAEALFWLDHPEESTEVRRAAYAAHVAAADHASAAMSAWQLYFDHALVGEAAVASGWLTRARAHAGPGDGSVVDGFVLVAEADHAHQQGDQTAAITHADRAVAIGRETGDRNLTAMALQTRGRLLAAAGQITDGLASLDDAMVSVITGELRPLFAGWVFCAVLGVCHDVADVRRAAEWTDAALRWCDELGDGMLYPGLCRIHRVELACLKGAWTTAEDEARRACDELLTHDPRYTGEAFYLAAELHRLRGDLAAAEGGFHRAHELGREPQPGLALVRLAQRRPAAAAAALRLTLEPGPSAPMERAALLAALVEAEIAVGDLDRAGAASQELTSIAMQTGSPYLEAMAATRVGMVALDRGEVSDAVMQLRRGRDGFRRLAMPYETSKVQVVIAQAAREAGDEETAALELRAAQQTFERLGASLDAQRARALLAGDEPAAGPLTAREIEVLRLVARGLTNREIGSALVVSEHTVARHLSNIFTKLSVTSRSAATAYAYPLCQAEVRHLV